SAGIRQVVRLADSGPRHGILPVHVVERIEILIEEFGVSKCVTHHVFAPNLLRVAITAVGPANGVVLLSVGVGLLLDVEKLLRRKYFLFARHPARSRVAVVSKIAGVTTATLRRDHDDAVRAARTVDRRRR